jgi:hypothetical protein
VPRFRNLRVPNQTGRATDFGPGSCPAESGTQVGALPPAEKGLLPPILRAGPGFGPGAAKTADPGRKSMDCQAGQRLRPKAILPKRGTDASAQDLRDSRIRNPGSGTAKRRTARASALTGSPRGNRKERKLRKDSGGSVPEPRLRSAPRNRPARTASPPRPGVTRDGTVGAGGDASPHYFVVHWMPFPVERCLISSSAGTIVAAGNRGGHYRCLPRIDP